MECQRFRGNIWYCNSCEASETGTVWGSNPYTGDSNECCSARHAGILLPGFFVLDPAPGQPGYPSSMQNGVETNEFGSPYDKSIIIRPLNESELLCLKSVKPCGQVSGPYYYCNDCYRDGSVWGSNPYTEDSNKCRAAKHAGMTLPGYFVCETSPGMGVYPASVNNGIESSEFGSYESSMVIRPLNENEVYWIIQNPRPCRRINMWVSYCSNCLSDKSVWGSNPYTGDSDRCRAAKHAGISLPGFFYCAPGVGLEEYPSSTRNMVTSTDYGVFGYSYEVRPLMKEEVEFYQAGDVNFFK